MSNFFHITQLKIAQNKSIAKVDDFYSMRIVLVLFFLFCLFFSSHAGDSIAVHTRYEANTRSALSFFDVAYANPAEIFFKYPHSLTSVASGFSYLKQDTAVILQNGNAESLFAIDVNSYTRRNDKTTLWGRANYDTGMKRNLLYNETSDYTLLYPYVMGDSVGGDLNTSAYYFEGGLARQAGQIVCGVEAHFRAVIEYRDVDPRPKNLVNELVICPGAVFLLKKGYKIGLAFKIGRYKQTNDLNFFSELGVPNVYHFTGLGTDYYRFRGSHYSAYYKGNITGGTLSFSTETNNGFVAVADYTRFDYEKVLSSLNELPMANLKRHSLKCEVGYLNPNDRKNMGIKATLEYSKTTGTENIFGTSTGIAYQHIASLESLFKDEASLILSGLLESNKSKRLSWHLTPQVGFVHFNEEYLSVNKIETTNFLMICESGISGISERFSWSLKGSVEKLYTLNSSFEYNKETYPMFFNATYHNYVLDKGNHTRISIVPEIGFSYNPAFSLNIKIEWEHNWYENSVKSDCVNLRVGVLF